MKLFESKNRLDIYEVNGTPKTAGSTNDSDKLIIREHWNKPEFVIIEFDGKKLTVSTKALKKAIENSENVHSF